MFTIDEIKKMEPKERLEVLALGAKLKKKKAQVVGLVERIAKNGWNDFHKYEYSTESDIKEGVRKLLSEAGLTLDIDLLEEKKVEVSTKGGKAWLHTVKMEFILTDNDTGYMDIKTSTGEATDNGDKGIYKAYSGCIKYYLINNFLISTGEKDNDPESGESEQVFNNGGNNNRNQNRNQNRNNNNQNRNNGGRPQNASNGSNNGGSGKGNSNTPKATKSTVTAKWKLLTGSEEGLQDYIDKKTSEGKTLDDIDKTLLGRIQADQAKKKKEAEEKKAAEANKMPEGLQYPPLEEGEKATDVETGKTYDYNGKEITLE